MASARGVLGVLRAMAPAAGAISSVTGMNAMFEALKDIILMFTAS